jgi:hypothetical protein
MMNVNLMTGLWCMDFVAIYKRQRFAFCMDCSCRNPPTASVRCVSSVLLHA